MSHPPIDEAYLQNTLIELINSPSLTSHTEKFILHIEQLFPVYPFVKLSRTRKGAFL